MVLVLREFRGTMGIEFGVDTEISESFYWSLPART